MYGASGAKPGDLIAVTKHVAMEGTAILASLFRRDVISKYGEDFYNRAVSLDQNISVVKEAVKLAESGLVTAMHDPTDGGLLEGLYELSEAANVGFIVYEDKIPLLEETMILAKFLGFDPLKLISSGTLLFTLPKENVEQARKVLDELNINMSVIGEVVSETNLRRVFRGDGYIDVTEPVEDELWRYG